MGAGDVYMRGHQKFGEAIRAAGLFAAGNIPFMLQNVGGSITRAMVCHMMAAFPSATFHFIDSSETLKDEVVRERLEPVNGLIRVPEKPGLCLTLDPRRVGTAKEQGIATHQAVDRQIAIRRWDAHVP